MKRFIFAPLLLVLLLSSFAFVRADPSQGFGSTCAYNDYGNTNNDAIYSVVIDQHQASNRGIQIISIADYKVPNGTNGFMLFTDLRVSLTQTFNKAEPSAQCDASSISGSFAATTVLWMAYNNVSQGGQLQNTQGVALGRASPSGDFQVAQAINGNAPTVKTFCCQVNDATITHQYLFQRVVSASNPAIGYNIVDLHFFRLYSSSEHKYKMWVDIVIDSSQTYNATIPSNAQNIGVLSTNGQSQMRWQVWSPNTSHEFNTRAEAYGGLYDFSFPVIEQSVLV